MSRTIWKFPLDWPAATPISIPATARVVLVAMDPATSYVAIWVEFDTGAPKVERRFKRYGTGDTIPGDGGYPTEIHVGSVIDGRFVWHVFEERS